MSLLAQRNRIALSLVIAATMLMTAGCGPRRADSSGIFEPHKIDIPQGNYLTQEMLNRVKPGMNRAQVRAALGTPLLNQLFHDDRWDYVFSYRYASGRLEQRSVTILFKGDQVSEILADKLPERDDSTDPALPGGRPESKGSASK
ncbi:MAG: outer membrane protein assembly factor BamE [Quisquiliibacterium sp.]